jgi:sugar phosphate isomerase/epimerase
MKYAFVSFSCPDANLATILEMARTYGYSGFEARSGVGHLHGIELGLAPNEIAQIRESFQASGITLQCLGVSCRYSEPETAHSNIAETLAYIQLAHLLSVPLLRVFCGKIPSGANRDETRERIVAALKQLAPAAADAGVTIVVETHDDWSNPKEMAAIMQAVDHQAVGVVWDVMHTLRGGNASMEEAYRVLRPWIRHVHFHDGLLDRSRLTFLPVGQGEIDHRPVVRILLENNYEGYLSGEWLKWEAPELHLPREIATMLRYEREMS